MHILIPSARNGLFQGLAVEGDDYWTVTYYLSLS